MTRLTLFVCVFITISSISVAQEPEPEELQFLILETLSNNPDLAAELASMKAAEARIPQAGVLDDPELRFAKREMPGFFAGQAMALSLEFMQMVRFPTKLWLQSRIAEVQADHAHHEHLEREIAVIRDLKSSFVEVWYARKASDFNREDLSLLAQLVRAAETRYSVGTVSQSEVLKLQIEFATLQADSARLHQEVTSAESMLRTLLNRDVMNPIGRIDLDSLSLTPPPLDMLLRFSRLHRPMLVHDSLQILEASLMTSAAKQEYIPDFKFSLEYMKFDEIPQKRWSASVSMSIPFMPWSLGKASGRVEEAQAQHLRRDALYRSTRNMVESGVRVAFARVESASVLEATFRQQLIPQANRVLSSTISEYQSGKTNYLMLIDSFRMYQMTRREAAMARMSLEQALAELAFQSGVIDLSIVPLLSKENQQ